MSSSLPRVSGTPLDFPDAAIFYLRKEHNQRVRHHLNIQHDGDSVFDFVLEIVDSDKGNDELQVGEESTTWYSPALYTLTGWNEDQFAATLCDFLIQNETVERIAKFIDELAQTGRLLWE